MHGETAKFTRSLLLALKSPASGSLSVLKSIFFYIRLEINEKNVINVIK